MSPLEVIMVEGRVGALVGGHSRRLIRSKNSSISVSVNSRRNLVMPRPIVINLMFPALTWPRKVFWSIPSRPAASLKGTLTRSANARLSSSGISIMVLPQHRTWLGITKRRIWGRLRNKDMGIVVDNRGNTSDRRGRTTATRRRTAAYERVIAQALVVSGGSSGNANGTVVSEQNFGMANGERTGQ